MTAIREGVFYGCSALASVTISDGATEISNEAFAYCPKLTNITIPNSVYMIYAGAFLNCDNLKTITIGNNVAEIYDEAFAWCPNLEQITCNATNPPALASNAFDGTPLSEIQLIVPCATKSEYKTEDGWKDFNNINNINKVTSVLLIEDCDCYDFSSAITIKDGGSLAFTDYLTAKTKLTGSTVILEKSMPKEKWSLIGNLSDKATYEFLKENYGDKNTTKKHAFAINAYDYTTNGWYANYQNYTDATPANYGAFFAYPFANELDSKKEDAVLDDDNIILMQSVTGTNINFGDIAFSATNDGPTKTEYDNARYFSLSNPYIGRLNLKKFYDDNASKIQSSYVWIYDNTAATPDWKAVEVSSNVALQPAGGFLVASAGDAKDLTLTFKPSQIVTDETLSATYKTDKSEKKIIFTARANEENKQMFAHFNEKASDGFDINDAYVIMSENENAVNPYFVVDNRQIFDNHFASLPYVCDINFNSYKDNHVDFYLTQNIDGLEVSVIDIENNNEETIMTKDQPFTITVNEGSNNGRYKIKIAKSDLSIADNDSYIKDIKIRNDDGKIFIDGNYLQSVQIINALGQTVYQQRLNGNNDIVNFNGQTGAYIVKVNGKNNTKSVKIIIK